MAALDSFKSGTGEIAAREMVKDLRLAAAMDRLAAGAEPEDIETTKQALQTAASAFGYMRRDAGRRISSMRTVDARGMWDGPHVAVVSYKK